MENGSEFSSSKQKNVHGKQFQINTMPSETKSEEIYKLKLLSKIHHTQLNTGKMLSKKAAEKCNFEYETHSKIHPDLVIQPYPWSYIFQL